MSKSYSFDFSGTKEMFLNQLNEYPNNNQKFFYFDDYIVELSENEVRFGVARGGHSGGYWFVPTITVLIITQYAKTGAVASAKKIRTCNSFLVCWRKNDAKNKKILKKRIKIVRRKERCKNLFFKAKYSILKLSMMLQVGTNLYQFYLIFSCYTTYLR